MITYNFVILDINKTINPFLNFLDEEEFLEKLWEWCYTDDLWDFIDENPEVLTNSEEEEQEAYEQAYEDWRCDCNINVDEATEEDLKDVAPGGDIDNIEIVYDERK